MKTGSEVATIIIPLLHSLLYSLPEIRDIFPPGLTQFHESRACISCSARSSPGQTSKATCKQVTALANPGKLFIHDIFWSKKLMCLSRGCLHCLFLTVCLLCFACRVTMYDYQAMCKVPYHHHSGARPLLSVCIVPRKPSWAGLLLQGSSSSPQKTSGDLCFQLLALPKLTPGRFLEQWWPLMLVSSVALKDLTGEG